MPRMDQAPATDRLIKLLLIGDGKIGKTRYAGEAAAAGFDVLYMGGDGGEITLAMLLAAAQQRIYLMGVGDTVMGGQRDHKFIDNFSEFCTNVTLRWNDSTGQIAERKDTGEIWEIRPAEIGPDTVFVLDSWTSLTESIMLKAAIKNGVFLDQATQNQMRPVYQSSALMATAALQLIRALNCHVIVIAHPDEYTHTTKPEGRKMSDASKENDLIVDWTKLIPKSTSKPHGMVMPKYFTDVAWMDVNPSGTTRRLDFRPKQNRVGGGHFDGIEDTEKHSFANLVKQIGGAVPDSRRPIATPSWLKIIPALAPGDEPATTESKVLDGTKGATIQGSGLKGLFGRPAATPA